jgi:hypothetical protein
MEPDRKQPTVSKPPPEAKPKRFRLVKIEDRIAPGYVGTVGCWSGFCFTGRRCR